MKISSHLPNCHARPEPILEREELLNGPDFARQHDGPLPDPDELALLFRRSSRMIPCSCHFFARISFIEIRAPRSLRKGRSGGNGVASIPFSECVQLKVDQVTPISILRAILGSAFEWCAAATTVASSGDPCSAVAFRRVCGDRLAAAARKS